MNHLLVAQNADSSDQKLDAVLPLTLKDYDRFKILQRSLDAFCKELLGTIWIVVPDAQLAEFKARIEQDNYCVISESALIPEIKLFPIKGWYLQQLIKLAIADHIKTSFYLTLDADVVCAKSIQFSDLVQGGRAVYYAVESDCYENVQWYSWAWAALKCEPRTQFNCYNVTPTVLCKAAVLQLQSYLRTLSAEEVAMPFRTADSKRKKLLSWLSWLLDKGLPEHASLKTALSDYRAYLIRNVPWTEYGLYYSFCEMQNILETYHIRTPHCIYSGEQSIWRENQYESWQPERCFEGERNFFFCVFQSNTQIPAEVIWQRIERFFC